MTKGLGTIVYLRADTVATNTFTTVCAVSYEGGGKEGTAETLEPCLDDTILLDFPADPKYEPITVEVKVGANTSAIDYTIADLVNDVPPTEMTLAVKIPYATPEYDTRTVYVQSATLMPRERNQDMKRQFVFLPQDDHSYSTTEPST